MSTIAPWSKGPFVARASLITSLETLRICGLCLQPFVPSLAEKLLDALGVDVHERSLRFAALTEADLATQIYGRSNNLTPGVRLFEIPHATRQPNSDVSEFRTMRSTHRWAYARHTGAEYWQMNVDHNELADEIHCYTP
jgi:hypothetical protein